MNALMIPQDAPDGLDGALRVLHEAGERIRFEACSGRVVCANLPADLGHFPEGEWTDAHTTEFTAALQRHELKVSTGDVDRAVVAHAKRHEYNALTDYVLQCASTWDGAPRVDQALATYWRAPDTEATRITSRVFLLSLAARALMPGCKVDTCVTFIGGQGLRKSTGLRRLVGDGWFADSPLPIGEKDGMQNLRGVWLWEFSENASLSRREMNQVKAFLSAQTDRFRASYARHAETWPRQTCFVASTNESDVLRDETGNRRFLPVVIGGEVDVSGIERDREQLIGEAAHRVLDGERYWPDAADDRELAVIRAEHEEHDAWEDVLRTWVEKRRPSPTRAALPPGGELSGGPFALEEAASGALGLTADKLTKREQPRIAACLKRIGLEKRKTKRGGVDVRLWWWPPASSGETA